MSEKQDRARRMIDDALDESIRNLDDVEELVRLAGLPSSPALTDRLREACAALTEARLIAAKLGTEP